MKYNITTQYGDAVLQYWTQKAFSVSQTLSQHVPVPPRVMQEGNGRGGVEEEPMLRCMHHYQETENSLCLSEILHPITVGLCQETWIPAKNQKGDLKEVN